MPREPTGGRRQKGASMAMRKTCYTGSYCCSRAPTRDAPVEQGSRFVHCHEFYPVLDCKMQGDHHMKLPQRITLSVLAALAVMLLPLTQAAAQQRPNILVIMGDDVGWFNIG